MSLFWKLNHRFDTFILLVYLLNFLLQRQALSFQLFPVGTFGSEQGFFL